MDRASFRTGLDPTNALVVRVIDGLRAPQGIQTLELPLTSPAALDAIRRTAELAGDRALVGAGTIRTADDARRAVDAGARFLVPPALTLPVLEHAVAHDIAVLPAR
jgi:2-dehydro-3-deoxyphosphogluconate aldolase/(4S)-4-hydroxy-2-oxoglutarate aldolase